MRGGPRFLGFPCRGSQRSGWRRMAGKHSPSDDNLLQLVAAKEKELEAKVAQAKADARRIVEDAQRQAQAVRDQARREAAELAARMQAEIARETDTLAAQRLAAAQAEVQHVRSRASERIRVAAELVVKRVLSGLE